MLGVEGIDGVDVEALPITADPGRVAQIKHGVAFAAKLHPLILARQKATRPLPGGDRLVLTTAAQGGQHHKAGQVGRLAAEAVGDPGPHARPASNLAASVHEHVGGVMVDGVSGHRPDQADVAEHRADLGKQAADFGAVRPHLFKGVLRGEADQWPALQLRQLLALGQALRHRLAVELGQLRLGVEGFQLGRPTGHRHPDHPLGLLRQRWLVEDAGQRGGPGRAGSGQRGDRHAAKALGRSTKEGTAGQLVVLAPTER